MPDQLDAFVQPRPAARPMIYAYSDPAYKGMLKVGFTAIDVAERVAAQYPTARPSGTKPYNIVFSAPALYADGGSFRDHPVHKALENMRGVRRENDATGRPTEWFTCSLDDLKAAYLAVQTRTENVENRTQNFPLRPEQREAVEKTARYFQASHAEAAGRIPKFLWNAKMRFGKTFATYQLAKKCHFRKILILTFKPAVQSAWKDDLLHHIDFEGWQFIARPAEPGGDNIDTQYRNSNPDQPLVCFGSFQDFLGVNRETGGIKAQNEWVHTTNWDLVVFDEYHYGAWKENARSLFAAPDDEEIEDGAEPAGRENALDETWLPITAYHYLYLSGTPFRAINSGEFIEEQIYNWTYADEQRAKNTWKGGDNPYAALPRMVLLAYKIPDSIRHIAEQGEFNEFDLNVFFKAEGQGEDAHFVYEEYVQKWLDLIRGQYLPAAVDELKQGREKPAMPFSDARLRGVLTHTLWLMPDVAACHAMANLLRGRGNVFYHDYKVNVCAGAEAGIGLAALKPVQESMADPLNSKTITLTCGKLTTGVTVRPWSGVFMLRNLNSPETYFQTAFRVQSPWVIDGENGTEIVKQDCYVFDFAIERALKQIADYSCRLNVEEGNPERKVGEFVNFLPVIAYDGSAMRQIDAAEILDMAMAGTSATLLARRWESALLVNVDNATLARLMANEQAMAALMRIEGFRSLNADIETIINKSEAVKKAKRDRENLTPKEKKELSEEEKEFKTKRKEIQEKLIKFATRIPVFMYLSDYREYCLKDVITQLEPALFKKVTGLEVKDFELLCELNVFNAGLMNDAVYKFKRYEEASLVYTGLTNRHAGENVGLYDTVLSEEEFAALNAADYARFAAAQRASLNGLGYANNERPARQEETADNDDDERLLEVAEEPEKFIPAKAPSRPAAPRNTAAAPSRPVPQPRAPAANRQAPDAGVKIGDAVAHKAFGVGRVRTLSGKRITVAFPGFPVKEFMFPGAFTDGFLRRQK